MNDPAAPVRDLGHATVKDVIRDALWPPGDGAAGRRILDIGTGNGALVRWLLREGADALGVEPNAALLEQAIRDPDRPAPRGRWLAAAAERLPVASAAIDAVLFFNSLHHIDPARQVAALAEAARVLRPGGAVIVVEPVAAGGYFELLAPLDDETEVRVAAQTALAAARGRLLDGMAEARFMTTLDFTDADAVMAGFVRADPTRAADAARVAPVIGERFLALGQALADGRRRFEQPMTVHRLRRA